MTKTLFRMTEAEKFRLNTLVSEAGDGFKPADVVKAYNLHAEIGRPIEASHVIKQARLLGIKPARKPQTGSPSIAAVPYGQLCEVVRKLDAKLDAALKAMGVVCEPVNRIAAYEANGKPVGV